MLRGRWIPIVSVFFVAWAPDAGAITPGAFTASGTYQRVGAPDFTVGVGGTVEEVAGFVKGAGPTAQLGVDPLPDGLVLSFASTLSADGTDLVLRYDFTNTSLAQIASGVTFVSFLDAEIDEPVNTFFNEYGETDGVLAAGQGFEIDEPGFTFGDIYSNALAGALDGTNAVPFSAPEDVSMALSFLLGTLAPGQIARFELMISEDGDALGGFRLRQRDIELDSSTEITFSGAASVVPEPGTALLLGFGLSLLSGSARSRRRI